MPEEIKKEPVEEDDGTYVCFICAESVGGRDALQCSQCQSIESLPPSMRG